MIVPGRHIMDLYSRCIVSDGRTFARRIAARHIADGD